MNNLYDQWRCSDVDYENQPDINPDLLCAWCGEYYNEDYMEPFEGEKVCIDCIEKSIYKLTALDDFTKVEYTSQDIRPAMSLHTATYFPNGDKQTYEKTWYYFMFDDKYKFTFYTSPTNYYKYDGVTGDKINQKLDYQILPARNICSKICVITHKLNDKVFQRDKYLTVQINFTFEE